jgi:omega-amidase
LIISANGLYYNRFVFITPKGEISFYDKRHLFSIGGESDLLSSGDQRKIVHYLGWRIALYVCYDIRFPVWCRNVDDTDLMIFTANWPDSRSEVWTVLLKTRAIENQVYVAGVNRTGTDGNGDFYKGESQMFNARGELVPLTIITGSKLLSYEISKQVLNDFRIKFPVANDADRFLII